MVQFSPIELGSIILLYLPQTTKVFFICSYRDGYPLTPTFGRPIAARRFAQRQGLTDEVEQVQHPAVLWKVGLGCEIRNLGTQHGSLEK